MQAATESDDGNYADSLSKGCTCTLLSKRMKTYHYDCRSIFSIGNKVLHLNNR